MCRSRGADFFFSFFLLSSLSPLSLSPLSLTLSFFSSLKNITTNITGIIAMEGRDAERFDGLTKRAEQLEKYLVELSDMSLRQRQALDGESSRRKATQDEQQKLVKEVRSALAKTDSDVSGRLTTLLTQIGEQLVAEREIHARKLDEQRGEYARQERAMEERAAMERDRMMKRFTAIEAGLREESEVRAQQTQVMARETDERAQELRAMVTRESAARAGNVQIMEETQQRVTERTTEIAVDLEKEVKRRLDSLEEITRTEIKARMNGMEKIHSSMSVLKNQQASSVNRARSEASKMLDQSNRDVEMRLRALESGMDKSQRESLIALSRSAQAQALLNADLGGRLDNLEQRELQDENETDAIKQDLTTKIDTFGRANQDAVGALSSVVADHRRESEEMVAKIQSDMETELENSAETMRQAITNFSTDVMSEIEKLREGTSTSIKEGKEDTLQMIDAVGVTIVELKKRVEEVVDAMDKKTKESEEREMRRKKEEALHREAVRDELDLFACTQCLASIMATVEANAAAKDTRDSLVTTENIRTSLETDIKTISESVESTDNRLTSLVEERTTKVSRGLDELRIEHASRLDQAVASTVTDSLTASVVETSIQERIAQVEKDTERRLKEMEEAEEAKVNKVNETLSTIESSMKQAVEDRARLEARVESVVGQVEEERNNAEVEWQKSMVEAQRQDDIEQDEPMVGGGDKTSELVAETGTLPTVDVGFPPPSDVGDD